MHVVGLKTGKPRGRHVPTPKPGRSLALFISGKWERETVRDEVVSGEW